MVAATAASVQKQRRSALAALVYTHGECAGESTEIWYPTKDASASFETAVAIAVCLTCPVREACLELALRIDAGQHGIWGGLDERERRTLRKAHKTRLAQARRLDDADARRGGPHRQGRAA